MDILSAVTSILGGGITGLVGSALQSVYQYKTRKLDIELEKQKAANEIELRKLDIQATAQEWAARTQIADITARAEVDQADAATLAKAYDSEPKQYSEKSLLTKAQNWVLVGIDALRAVVRPGLTLYLCVLTTAIYIQTRGLIQGNPVDSFQVLEKLVDTVLYLTTTCVLFWFGSRNKMK